MRGRGKVILALLILLAVHLFPAAVRAERIKDIARVGAVRANQLVGYGLVVGLDGTGDSNAAQFTIQSVAAALQRFGVTVPPGLVRVKNVAAVIVTADLPAFAKNGNKLDVTVSTLGDARSLLGGTLIQTPLSAADGGVYAVAQGNLTVGGFAAGGGGNSTTKNHVAAGRVPGGALVEREVPTTLLGGGGNTLSIALNQADFTTATRVAEAIRAAKLGVVARASDAGTVEVSSLDGSLALDAVGLIARIEALPVVSDAVARVVINEKTGTIVIGGAVSVAPCAVAHGSLTIKIRTRLDVSQPNPLAAGTTVVAPRVKVEAADEGGRVQAVPAAASVDQIVKALNGLGVTPRDLIAILQALKAAGALKAELEIL